MFQQFYQPHEALKGFVNNVMIHQVQLNATQIPKSFQVPPLPEHCLFFYVRDKSDAVDISTNKRETQSSCIVVGPHINRHSVIPGRNHLMIKVGFQPGGLYRFLGIPMHELLCNDAFDAVDFLGKEINEVNEKLQEAISFLDMKLIVEKFLLTHINKLKQALPIDEVLPLLIKQHGLIKEQKPGISWIKIAHECGYFDQMHLIHDFKEFAGVNPSVIESELLNSPVKFFNRLFC